MADITMESPRIAFGHPVYNEVMDFLIEEAHLLDEDLLEEWLQLLAADVRYVMPTRHTVRRSDGKGFDSGMKHFDDDYKSIEIRVLKVTRTDTNYAEDPPSRIRRYITNIQVNETPTVDEFAVTSYLLLLRNRRDEPISDVVSGIRHDILRRDATTRFKLARREVLVDQVTLGTPNLAFML
jgi:3-phenylpropionate/cinnamic acid dioxygenase small subunit